METKSVSITTISDEGKKSGIFFRSPIQKVYKESFSMDENIEGVYGWRRRALYQIIPFLLNIRVWFKVKEWEKNEDFAGMKVRELCSPIYFERQTRTVLHKIVNHPTISEIEAYGWEPYKNYCSGDAEKEVAIIKFKDGKKIKKITKGSFNYCYAHVVEQELKQGLTLL
jgi:hypothetical protein